MLKLYIHRNKKSPMKEELLLPNLKKVPLIPFGVANALLHDFPLVSGFEESLERIRSFAAEGWIVRRLAAAALKRPSIYLLGIPPGEALRPLPFPGVTRSLPPEYCLLLEMSALSSAFLLWLYRKGGNASRKPSEKYTDWFKKTLPPFSDAMLRLEEASLLEEILADLVSRKRKSAASCSSGSGNSGMDARESAGASLKKIVALALRYGELVLKEAVIKRQKDFSTTFVSFEVEKRRRSSYTGGVSTEIKRVPARLYESDNLLPLAWAEVLFAVENDIYARQCYVCGNWFPLTKGQAGQQKFCSVTCRSESKRFRAKKNLR